MTQEKQYYSIRYMLENITAKLNSIDNRLKTVESKYLYNPISEIRNLIKKKADIAEIVLIIIVKQ